MKDEDWRKKLTDMQYRVLRQAATERPFSSSLNDEYGRGRYRCAGCGAVLFTAAQKFDSGCGWPSFYDVMPDAIQTSVDYNIGVARTEYHCANCGGHHGHVFEDGPAPTGLRYCNNGVSLVFEPEDDTDDKNA